MPVLPGAGAYRFEGNEVGCLLVHGFTGTPQNVRPLADYLARRGLAVSAPRLPGHGTTVADLDRTGPDDWLGAVEHALAELRQQCRTVFVAGIDKANGPFVLDHIGSRDKRLLPLSDSSHEVTLDVDRERVMVEIYDFITSHATT